MLKINQWLSRVIITITVTVIWRRKTRPRRVAFQIRCVLQLVSQSQIWMDVNSVSRVCINNRTSARTIQSNVSVVSKVISHGGGVSAWHKVFNIMLWFLLHDWQVHAYWWSHLFVVSARRSVYTGTWTACKHAEFQLVWNSLHARHSYTMNAKHPTACLHDVDIHAWQCKHRITPTLAMFALSVGVLD